MRLACGKGARACVRAFIVMKHARDKSEDHESLVMFRMGCCVGCLCLAVTKTPARNNSGRERSLCLGVPGMGWGPSWRGRQGAVRGGNLWQILQSLCPVTHGCQPGSVSSRLHSPLKQGHQLGDKQSKHECVGTYRIPVLTGTTSSVCSGQERAAESLN